jgi:predicted nuclease with RNAse H fold
MYKIAGIDYGSKLAGTTAIAFPLAGSIRVVKSKKKQDADAFILRWVEEYAPEQLFIDAPLSLPGVYRHPEQYEDYFYRKADRQLSAMSPMFLGGLTARAMRLRAAMPAIQVMEVYPGGLARLLALDLSRYKKDKAYLPEAIQALAPFFTGYEFPAELPGWHSFDALLALASGYRFMQARHITYGTAEEGQIIL